MPDPHYVETLKPLIDALISVAALMITAFGSVLIKRLLDKLKLQNEAAMSEKLLLALQNGVMLTADKLMQESADWSSLTTRSKLLAGAVAYANDTVPGYIAKLKKDPEDLSKIAEAMAAKVLGATSAPIAETNVPGPAGVLPTKKGP